LSFLLLSDSYFPDRRSSALIVKSIYQKLKEKKYECKVISLTENEAHTKNTDLELIQTFKFRNLNFLLRGLSTIYYIIKIVIRVYIINYTPKLIYIYYPSFMLLFLIPFIKLRYKKAQILIHYQDHFPENAYDLKIIKNKFIFNFLKTIRKNLINKKIIVVVNSKKLRNKLKSSLKIKNIFFFHNWPLIQKVIFKKNEKNKLFTFIYSGNIGPAQDFMNILDFFAKTQLNIQLEVYGDGRNLVNLKSRFSNHKKINFYKFIQGKNLSKIYHNSSASIICLSMNNKTSFIPSKFYDYVNHNLPIFALIHKECDLNQIIHDYNLGLTINNLDFTKIEHNIINFIKNFKSYKKSCHLYNVSDNLDLFTNFLISNSNNTFN
jgi:hypothetical protein